MTSNMDVRSTRLIDHKQLIDNAGYAMGELGNLVSSFETTLIDSSQDTTFTTNATLRAQDLDLISQTVNELRGLLIRIASQTPENVNISYNKTLGPIRLEGLRQTLLTGPSSPQEQPHRQPSAIQLFD